MYGCQPIHYVHWFVYASKIVTNNEKAGTIFLSASREVWPQTSSCWERAPTLLRSVVAAHYSFKRFAHFFDRIWDSPFKGERSRLFWQAAKNCRISLGFCAGKSLSFCSRCIIRIRKMVAAKSEAANLASAQYKAFFQHDAPTGNWIRKNSIRG